MEYDQSDLDEVVVIGYGTATKKDLTGAVARFDSKIIEESTATNIAHMMQGQVAGLSILNGDGSSLISKSEGIGTLSTTINGAKAPVREGTPRISSRAALPGELCRNEK